MSKTPPLCFVMMPFTVRPEDLPKYLDDKEHWHQVYATVCVKGTGISEPDVGMAAGRGRVRASETQGFPDGSRREEIEGWGV